MRAEPDGLLGLFLLYFSRYYFYEVFSFINPGGTTPDELRDVLTFAGFPLEVETLACVFITVRVVREWLFFPDTYKAKFPSILFPLWLFAFIPVIIGVYINFGKFNWTGGIRYLMITGSYFYGYILAKNWPKGENKVFLDIMLPLVFVMLVIMNLSFFWSHHGFLFLGLGAAFSIYYMREKIFKYRLFGLILFGLSAGYVVRGSLTMMLVVVLSLFFAYLGAKKRKVVTGFRSRLTKFAGNAAILGIFIFTAYTCYYGFNQDYDPTAMYGSYTGDITEKAEAKLLSDRLPIWSAALDQIISEPTFFVTPIRYMAIPGHDKLWMVSSHNTILEALRINGLITGTIMLIIIFFALKNSLKVLGHSDDPVLKSIAAAFLGVTIAMLPLNVIVINMTAGFWILSLAGLCHGIFMQDTPVSAVEMEET